MKNNSKSFSESAIFLNFIVSAFLTKKLLIFIAFKVICQCSLTSMLQIIMISSLEMLYLVVSKTFVFLYVRCFFTDHNIKVKKSCHLYQHFTEDIIYIWYSVFSVLFFFPTFEHRLHFSPYLSSLSLNAGNYGHEKLRIAHFSRSGEVIVKKILIFIIFLIWAILKDSVLTAVILYIYIIAAFTLCTIAATSIYAKEFVHNNPYTSH